MIAAVVLAALIVIVPHGDDEITLMPLIQATEDVTVVIMTDGAATSRCGNLDYESCEALRRSSTESFLEEVAPHAKLVWIGSPDGELKDGLVRLVAANICPGCEIAAAGADYGHPDHDAVRAGVEAIGGWVYDGSLYADARVFSAMLRWYGWLLSVEQYEIVGISLPGRV